MNGRDVHRQLSMLLSSALVVVGIVVIVRTLSAGGGAGAVGLLLGVLFVAAGAGRLWVIWKGGQ